MITRENFGKHENVLIMEFGTGDISFVKARRAEDEKETMLIFRNQDPPREIGETDDRLAGKTTDEIEGVQCVMVFKKPESITALIHSLIELQKEVFK